MHRTKENHHSSRGLKYYLRSPFSLLMAWWEKYLKSLTRFLWMCSAKVTTTNHTKTILLGLSLRKCCYYYYRNCVLPPNHLSVNAIWEEKETTTVFKQKRTFYLLSPVALRPMVEGNYQKICHRFLCSSWFCFNIFIYLFGCVRS